MKNIITTLILILSFVSKAQVQPSSTTKLVESPGFKVTQGFIVGGITELILRNTETFEDEPILRGAIAVVTSMLVESGYNGLKSNKMGYVAAGSISASIVINIWDPKGRTYTCKRRNFF